MKNLTNMQQAKSFAVIFATLALTGCNGGGTGGTSTNGSTGAAAIEETNTKASALRLSSGTRINSGKDDAAGLTSTANGLIFVGTYGYAANGNAKDVLTTSLYPKVSYTSVAYGNGRYVAVGEAGQIITSLDGNTWMTETNAATQKLNSVSFDGSVFVAAGEAGVILQSKDGMNWDNSLSSKVAYPYNSVAGDGSGSFVAVGNNGVIYSTKASARIASPTSLALTTITYANGTYVAGGINGVLLASNDGVSWKLLKSPVAKNLKSIKFVNGSFVAVGDLGAMLVSDNGYDWKDVSIYSYFGYADIATNPQDKSYMLIGTNTKYALIGTGYDLSTWNFYQGLTTTYLVNSVVCGEINCVIVGNKGMNLSSDNNGKSWSLLKSGTEYTLQSVANNGKITVAVGNNGVILVSNDNGLTWETSTAGNGKYSLMDVKYYNDNFYSVGTNGTLLRSSDGYKWETLKSGVATTLQSIVFAPTLVDSEFYPFMILGDNGVMLASRDGNEWVQQAIETKNSLRDAVYNPDEKVFYIVGTAGTMFVADNGIKTNNAKAVTPVKGLTANLNNIEFATIPTAKETQNMMVTIGAAGTILAYTNGSWVQVKSGTTSELRGLAVAQGSFYASGYAGSLIKVNVDLESNTPVASTINSHTNIGLLGVFPVTIADDSSQQVLQQAGEQSLSQANEQSQSVLQLLR